MAILGRNSASGFGNSYASTNQIIVYKATLAAAGHLDELWASLRSQSGTFNVRCVIFDDDGASGEPGTLLAVGADKSVTPTGTRQTYGGAVVTPLNLSAGNYWLGVHSASNFLEYDDNNSSIARRSTSDTFSDGTANPWIGTSTPLSGADMQVWGVLSAIAAIPVADFTGTPLTGTAPLSVAFTDTSTNTPTSWAWDFGDGGTSTAQNPTHSYSSGVYTVALTATNAAGSNTKTRTGYVSLTEPIVYAAGGGIEIY